MGWRQVGAVIGGDRILAEPAWWLDGHHAAEVDPGEGQVVVVDAHLAGAGPHVDSTAWRRAAGRVANQVS